MICHIVMQHDIVLIILHTLFFVFGQQTNKIKHQKDKVMAKKKTQQVFIIFPLYFSTRSQWDLFFFLGTIIIFFYRFSNNKNDFRWV